MVYPFFLEERKLKNLHDKKYVIHIINLKQALDLGLVLENVHELLNSIKKLG